jgi:hypothetical protein
MRIVRDIKIAQRGDKERLKKKVQAIPTPFGAHVGKPDIRKNDNAHARAPNGLYGTKPH